MNHDKLGNVLYSEQDLVDLLYRDQLNFVDQINLPDTPNILKFKDLSGIDLTIFDSATFDGVDLEEFDQAHQENWYIPEEYKNFDVERYCVNLCTTDVELLRVREELDEFQKRKMMPLLKWLKYLVDTCRKNNIVWGVGRGSSVSSFVLFLIGVHKIDPIKYGLDWQDFLR
jgi:DNA polymerase III alpha subunit